MLCQKLRRIISQQIVQMILILLSLEKTKKKQQSSFELASSHPGSSARGAEGKRGVGGGAMKGWGKDGRRHLHQHGDGVVGMETSETARRMRRPQHMHPPPPHTHTRERIATSHVVEA